jgi:O-antigen/teichoic acid export membrane protein
MFRGIALALTAASVVIAARSLGPEDRGVLAAALAGPAIAALVAFLGLGVANVYFVARGEIEAPEALGTSLVAAFSIGSLAAIAYVAVALIFRQAIFHGLPSVYIVVGALIVPSTLALRYVTAILQGLQRIMSLNYTWIVHAGATVLLYLVFLVVLDLGPLAALWIAVLALLLGLIAALVVLVRGYGRPRFDRGYISRGARFGAKGEAGNLIAFLGYRLDVVIVTALLGFAAAGNYAVAFAAVELLWVFPSALSIVLFPGVAAADRAEASHSVGTTTQLARLMTLLLVVCGVVGGAIAPVVIPLVFSEQYRAAIAPLELLIPGVILYGVQTVLTSDLSGRGHPGVVSAVTAVGVVLMVALDLLLMPALGLPGAAIASSISYAFVFVLSARIFTRITGAPARSLLVPRKEDLAYVRAELAGLRSSSRRASNGANESGG